MLRAGKLQARGRSADSRALQEREKKGRRDVGAAQPRGSAGKRIFDAAIRAHRPTRGLEDQEWRRRMR